MFCLLQLAIRSRFKELWQYRIRTIVGLLSIAGILIVGWWLGGLYTISLSVNSQFAMDQTWGIALPPVLTLLCLCIFGWQCLRAPIALWNNPEVEWLIQAPVSKKLILVQVFFRLLTSFGGILSILICAGIVVLTRALQENILFFITSIGMLFLLLLFSTLLALLAVQFLTVWVGRRHIRTLIFCIIFTICITALVFISLLTLPALSFPIVHNLAPFAFLAGRPMASIFFAIIGVKVSGFESSLLTNTVYASTFLVLLVILGLSNFMLVRSAYMPGWEGLYAAPVSSLPPERQSDQQFLQGGLLWRLASNVPVFSAQTWGIIGLCWQDARYDWTRWALIIPSTLIPLLFFLRISNLSYTFNIFAPMLLFLLSGGICGLFTQTIGFPCLKQVMQGREWLQPAPIRASFIFIACVTSVAFPILVFDLLFVLPCIVFIHPPLLLSLLLFGCILVESLCLSIANIASSAFMLTDDAHNSSHNRSRLSALIFLISQTVIISGALSCIWPAFLLTLPLNLQILLVRVFNMVLHTDTSTLQWHMLPILLPILALSTPVILTCYCLRCIQSVLIEQK